MEIRYSNHPEDSKFYTTEELRDNYLQEKIFAKDEINLTYSHTDRIVFGGAMPVSKPVELIGGAEIKAEYFLERREMGVINVGGKGSIEIDGVAYDMKSLDGIYIGMGSKQVVFKSENADAPAKFYINSSPAHCTYPTVKIDIDKANKVNTGDPLMLNKRVINQYIHPAVMKSCQLTMGLTQLEPCSCWNTMPCHTHERRMEVYFYFDLPQSEVVFHMMGQPQETRHIVVKNEEAVISPSWSIHSGVGTTNYSFIWGMCGENKEFTDMDGIKTNELQ